MKRVVPNGEKLKNINERYKPRLGEDDKQRSCHSFILSFNKYLFSTWNAPGTKAKYRRYTFADIIKML